VRRAPALTVLGWPWLVALAPAAVCALASAALTLGIPTLPIVRLSIDIATIALLTGLGLTLAGLAVAAGITLTWRRAEQRQQRALAEASAAAAQDRRRFLQRLDHELKNPLTAMQAGLALAKENEGGQSEALGSVEAQVRRISRLTADLRKLAELESRPLELAPVDLADLLTQVVELGQDRAAGRRLTLSLPQAPWPLPTILGDADLLLLVAHNLLDNAIKYSRPGDTLEVRASEDGNSVVVEVADTGPGIPAGEVPHVWEELYRGQGARGVPGSGLGLALTQAIVQRHGGEIAVRSREAQGTVVTVRLPIRHA
jgi:two-component system, OmpR family, sensor kinase